MVMVTAESSCVHLVMENPPFVDYLPIGMEIFSLQGQLRCHPSVSEDAPMTIEAPLAPPSIVVSGLPEPAGLTFHALPSNFAALFVSVHVDVLFEVKELKSVKIKSKCLNTWFLDVPGRING